MDLSPDIAAVAVSAALAAVAKVLLLLLEGWSKSEGSRAPLIAPAFCLRMWPPLPVPSLVAAGKQLCRAARSMQLDPAAARWEGTGQQQIEALSGLLLHGIAAAQEQAGEASYALQDAVRSSKRHGYVTLVLHRKFRANVRII